MSNFLNTHRLERLKQLAKSWVRSRQVAEPLGLEYEQAAQLCNILFKQGLLERRYVKVWVDHYHRFAGFEYKVVSGE